MRVRSWLPGLLVVVACTAALLAGLKRATPVLNCPDGYFHIRYAEVLRTEGLSRTFPWWQETFLRDHWADKDFVLHLLLLPFAFGDLLFRAKVASVVFASAAMGVFYLAVRALRVPWPSLWALGLLASSSGFMFRLGAQPASAYDAQGEPKRPLPGLHAPEFAPAAEPTLRTGVSAMSALALAILGTR